LQAAILLVKLKYLDEYARKRNEVATFYDSALSTINEIETPFRSSNSTHVYHQYTLKLRGINRNDFKDYLAKKGVPSMVYYPVPLHLQKAYFQPEFGRGSFPVTEKLSETVISLPIHTEMSLEQLEFIVTTIKGYL
jgi:UDP-2-acetamido-2-deoxy-ribo-hexuluronate aminotransferase